MIPRRLRRGYVKPKRYILQFPATITREEAEQVRERFEAAIKSRRPVIGIAGAEVKEIHR